jgi:hypothetical protein
VSSIIEITAIGKKKIESVWSKPEVISTVKLYQNSHLVEAGYERPPVSMDHPLYAPTFQKASFQWHLEHFIEELQNLFGDATYEEEIVNYRKDIVPTWPDSTVHAILKFTGLTKEQFIILTKYDLNDSYIRFGLQTLKNMLYKVTGALEERGMMN